MGTLAVGILSASLAVFISVRTLAAQPDRATPNTFEVAAIKVLKNSNRGGSLQPSPDGLTASNVPLRQCIEWAWNLRSYQVVIPPRFIKDDDTLRYDIAAKASNRVAVNALRLMLRSLLTDRFGMATHRGTMSMSVFALTVSNGGPRRLAPPEDGEGTEMTIDTTPTGEATHWVFHNSPLQSLVGLIGRGLSRPLIDQTGLAGKYTFSFVEPVWDRATVTLEDHTVSEVFPAIQRQLGLRVVATTASVDVLFVDAISATPIPN